MSDFANRHFPRDKANSERVAQSIPAATTMLRVGDVLSLQLAPPEAKRTE